MRNFVTGFVRRLIILIVAALLPLQGYAAAAMISCGPMHARVMTQLHDEAAHDGHAAHPQGHHEATGEQQGDSERGAPQLPDILKFKCSACAACCTAGLGPAYLATFTSVMRTAALVNPFSDSLDNGIVPNALERPPRTTPA
jgi:hypothetical protein